MLYNKQSLYPVVRSGKLKKTSLRALQELIEAYLNGKGDEE